jgi:hypothetical protein
MAKGGLKIYVCTPVFSSREQDCVFLIVLLERSFFSCIVKGTLVGITLSIGCGKLFLA